MFLKIKSEASIALIVAAVIGLIIIVVVVMVLTGKLGAFSRAAADTQHEKNCGSQSVSYTLQKYDGLGCNPLSPVTGSANAKLKNSCGDFENTIKTSDAIAKGQKCCALKTDIIPCCNNADAKSACLVTCKRLCSEVI